MFYKNEKDEEMPTVTVPFLKTNIFFNFRVVTKQHLTLLSLTGFLQKKILTNFYTATTNPFNRETKLLKLTFS